MKGLINKLVDIVFKMFVYSLFCFVDQNVKIEDFVGFYFLYLKFKEYYGYESDFRVIGQVFDVIFIF